MIYDCFSYWDEDLLLDLRLNILDKYINKIQPEVIFLPSKNDIHEDRPQNNF